MKPIKTKRELRAAQQSIHGLCEQLTLLKHTYRHDAEAFELATGGLRELLKETRRAVAVYERAQVGDLPATLHARNPRTGELELPRLLRLLRVAAQLDQEALAARLDTQQANISRWEREGCEGYTVRQLRRIADVLGYDVDVCFVRRAPSRARRRA